MSDDIYPPGHQPCQRCGVIVPWEELKMVDGWMMCAYCFAESTESKRRKSERAAAQAVTGRCPQCGKPSESLRVLSNGELVCENCFELVHRAKHGEPKSIAGRIIGIVDWLLGRKKGGKTYE